MPRLFSFFSLFLLFCWLIGVGVTVGGACVLGGVGSYVWTAYQSFLLATARVGAGFALFVAGE